MQQKKIAQAKSIEQVYNSAYWHLAQQDKTLHEMQMKLARKTENQVWIDTVLSELCAKKYIKSDIDFAIHFAEFSFNNSLGINAIKYKLNRRGIDERDIDTAISHVMHEHNIDLNTLASDRLNRSFSSLANTTKEKVYSQMTAKGFTTSEIEYAITCHPERKQLKTQLEVKAAKADIHHEICKLYRKGKGKLLIKNELRAKLISLDNFDSAIESLELDGEIDFYQSCRAEFEKKRFDISNYTGKSKAYAYLTRKGFDSDEIKEALNGDLES